MDTVWEGAEKGGGRFTANIVKDIFRSFSLLLPHTLEKKRKAAIKILKVLKYVKTLLLIHNRLTISL